MRAGSTRCLCRARACHTGAHAQVITVGPYTFASEASFADTAEFHGDPAGLHWAYGRDDPFGTANIGWLTGYTPYNGVSDLGDSGRGDYLSGGMDDFAPLDFGFVDVRAVNGPGPDLVVFNAHSPANYEVAVRPVGGVLSEYRVILWESRTPTSEDGHGGPYSGPPAATLAGINVDLTEYGIEPGVEIDLLRVRQSCATTPPLPPPFAFTLEADIAMAAVIHPPCPCDDATSARGIAIRAAPASARRTIPEHRAARASATARAPASSA